MTGAWPGTPGLLRRSKYMDGPVAHPTPAKQAKPNNSKGAPIRSLR